MLLWKSAFLRWKALALLQLSMQWILSTLRIPLKFSRTPHRSAMKFLIARLQTPTFKDRLTAMTQTLRPTRLQLARTPLRFRTRILRGPQLFQASRARSTVTRWIFTSMQVQSAQMHPGSRPMLGRSALRPRNVPRQMSISRIRLTICQTVSLPFQGLWRTCWMAHKTELD